MNRPCRLCTTRPVTPTRSERYDLCDSCTATLGVMEMPPAQRPARPCNRCESMRFIRVIPRDQSAAYDPRQGFVGRAYPMALTFVPQPNADIFVSGPANPSDDPRLARGRLETYVCAGCGFVEWYCFEPQSIPLGPEYMAEIIDYATTPYR